jgi:hypothetical protein
VGGQLRDEGDVLEVGEVRRAIGDLLKVVDGQFYVCGSCNSEEM